jgi:hypothetical protein
VFLECGRQLAPHFRTSEQLASDWEPLRMEVDRDGIRLWPLD